MERVIAIIKKLFTDISAALDLSTDLLLLIGMGALVLLLIILMIVRKKPRRQKTHKDSDSGFLEVGPEPVIVYGRSKKQEAPQPEAVPEFKPEQKPEPEPLPQFDLNPEFEPEPEPLPQFDLNPAAKPEAVPQFDLTPEHEQEPVPQFDFTPQPQRDFPPEPEPEPVSPLKPEPLDLSSLPEAPEISPFQRYMNAGPGQETATAFKPALAQDPLPLLESDFAGEILLLFSKQGFTIETVVYHGTYGADFIVASKGMRAYVQVKDWKKKATPRTVQEARYYSNTNGCHKTILIPVAGYTNAANREAAQRAVFLWNAKTLKKIRNGELSLEEWIAASSF